MSFLKSTVSLVLLIGFAQVAISSTVDRTLWVDESLWEQSRQCGMTPPTEDANGPVEYRFDQTLIQSKLSREGLVGWMHGVVPRYKQFIFTYRKEDPTDPMAFFSAQQFSLIPSSPELAMQLASLKRHDKVKLRGDIQDVGSPIVHILLSSVEILKKYESPTTNDYIYDPESLVDGSELDVFAMVHAKSFSDDLGWGLVVETKDFLMPIALAPEYSEIASTLFRGDIVALKLGVSKRRNGPPHFYTSLSRTEAVVVVDPLVNCHARSMEISGILAKFNKSPAISRDVYAVRFVDFNNMARNFTFFPASDVSQEEFVEIFEAISAKARAVWESASEQPEEARNFRIKRSIKVKANGMINVISTEQANAQIYIRSADQVTFEITE